MDEMHKDNPKLKLEDILREFGDFEETSQQTEEDILLWEPESEQMSDEDILLYDPDAPKEPEEDILIWGREAEYVPAHTQAPSSDTVRLDDITRAVKEQTQTTESTIRFTPVGGEDEDAPMIILPPEPETEPYSEEWEPEYEQPMGEYVPLEPLVFRPKSRLHELKKKLIAGPEKRYYELMEKGLGKLQLAILANAVVAALSAAATGMFAMGIFPEGRMRFLVFGQFLALLLSALLGSYQLIEGVTDLLKRRFSPNTLLLFSFIACVADGILCLRQVRVPCCAPFSLNVTMSLWAAYQQRNTEIGQMDTLRKATRLDSVVLQEGYYQDKPGFLRGQGNVEDFMDHYTEPSDPEKKLSTYALIALFVAVGIGVLTAILRGVASGLQFFGAALLVAMPATGYITLSRPMAILQRRLHKLGTVLCGWRGVMGLNKNAVLPLNDTDLFPGASAKLNGLKFYGSRNPDQVVAYGAAVIIADGGGMAPLFTQLLESRNGYHYEVETLRSYPNGGIGGIVNGEPVLVGSLSFMDEMGVEMPQGTKVNQAVYVAVDGVLNGVFAIAYSKMKSATIGLTTLCTYRNLTPILTAGDFMLTDEFIRRKFGVNTKRILFPERKVRQQLAAMTADPEAEALALTTREGLASFAYAVTGAKALRTASVLGVGVHIFAGALGLLCMLVLTLVDAGNLLTPGNILLFELAWMIPGLLITEWTRSI